MRIFLITIIVILLLALGAGAYLYFVYKPNVTKTQTATTASDASYKLAKISDDAVVSPTVSKDTEKAWYFNSKGQLFHRSLSGADYSEFSFPASITNFRKAFWPATGNDFIYSSFENNISSFVYFDSTLNTFKQLPKNVVSFDWMPDATRIVYVWKAGDGKSQQLVLANADTTGFKIIANLQSSDYLLRVSTDGKFVLLVPSKVADPSPITLVDVQKGTVTTLISSGRNTDARWVDANRFIYVVTTDGGTPQLRVHDIHTNLDTNLGLEAGLDKVGVDENGWYAYAVVDNAGIEKLVQEDLTNNHQNDVFTFDSNTKPKNLFVSGNKIFFINSTDQTLNYLYK